MRLRSSARLGNHSNNCLGYLWKQKNHLYRMMPQSEGFDEEIIEVFLAAGNVSFDNAPIVLPSHAAVKLTAAQRRWTLLKNLAVGCRRFTSLTSVERRFLYEAMTADASENDDQALTSARDTLRALITVHQSQLMTTEAQFLENLVQSPNATVSQLKKSAEVLDKDPLFNLNTRRGSLGSIKSLPKKLSHNDNFRTEVWTYSKPSAKDKDEKSSSIILSERPQKIKAKKKGFLYRFLAKRPKKSSPVLSKEDDAIAKMLISPVIFSILGTYAKDTSCHPHVLSPPMMDALRPFLPAVVQQDNFWLKYSMARDGASMRCLLSKVRASARCLIAIETMNGQVFGSFTSTPFRPDPKGFYGSGEAFVWKLSQSRFTPCETVEDQVTLESSVKVFEWTGSNRNVQCVHSPDASLLIGGGGPDNDPTLGGRSALTIEPNLEHGFSDACVTFDSPSLCGEGGIFEIANLEVWTLTPVNCHELAERLELGRQFVFDHGHFAQH